MIFTEFFTMVEETFSPEMVEKIIDESNLPNKGAYSDVGTYDYKELINLVTNLSVATGISIPELQIAYGKYLFKRFLKRYPDLILNSKSSFEFLKHVDDHIHVEVLKLYPDASLPRFECEMINPNRMSMVYKSNHPFAHLAEGLILGCAEHFNEKVDIQINDLGETKDQKFNFNFLLNKQG